MTKTKAETMLVLLKDAELVITDLRERNIALVEMIDNLKKKNN